MIYQSLKKLYYAKPDEYMRIYKSRFECEDTVHLEFCVNKKQVFFTLNSEVMGLAYDIAKLDKSVTSLGISLPEIAKSQYLRKCLIDEIVLTNQIEGVV
ncbi:MAG: Fic family protein, partial [Erysipelotrichaceae bacterium]|nr:Fic family protein [Erysipelotrichaceae bacterium]